MTVEGIMNRILKKIRTGILAAGFISVSALAMAQNVLSVPGLGTIPLPHDMQLVDGKGSSVVTKTEKFDLPLQRKKNGTYKIPSGNLVYTCFTSDFLIEDADEWRAEAWEMMQIRQDLRFLFITKRIDRLQQCLPPDWGDGYDNVTICCTMENQDRVDYRLPIYKEMPIKHKIIICEPLLSRIDFRGELGEWVEQVVAGGESGKEVRVCDYEWVLDIRQQCIDANVSFWFKQTGSYLLKDGHEYKVARQFQHSQARKAELNYTPDK